MRKTSLELKRHYILLVILVLVVTLLLLGLGNQRIHAYTIPQLSAM